jgi:hypothetical protein
VILYFPGQFPSPLTLFETISMLSLPWLCLKPFPCYGYCWLWFAYIDNEAPRKNEPEMKFLRNAYLV